MQIYSLNSQKNKITNYTNLIHRTHIKNEIMNRNNQINVSAKGLILSVVGAALLIAAFAISESLIAPLYLSEPPTRAIYPKSPLFALTSLFGKRLLTCEMLNASLIFYAVKSAIVSGQTSFSESRLIST